MRSMFVETAMIGACIFGSAHADSTLSHPELQSLIGGLKELNAKIEHSAQLTGFDKNYYCVFHPNGFPQACEDCWNYIGGEGGRAECAAEKGPGSVRFGKCSEKRNRPPCP